MPGTRRWPGCSAALTRKATIPDFSTATWRFLPSYRRAMRTPTARWGAIRAFPSTRRCQPGPGRWPWTRCARPETSGGQQSRNVWNLEPTVDAVAETIAQGGGGRRPAPVIDCALLPEQAQLAPQILGDAQVARAGGID